MDLRISKNRKKWNRSLFRLEDNLSMSVEDVRPQGKSWSFEALVFTRVGKDGQPFQFTIKAELIPSIFLGLKALVDGRARAASLGSKF